MLIFQMMLNEIKLLLNKTDNYYRTLLDITSRSKLFILEDKDWNNLCNQNNLKKEVSGIFLPRNMSAYVKENNEFLPLNIIHELYGHGLFFEFSKRGRFFTKLEEKLFREEKKLLKGRRFSMAELEEARKQSSTFSLLKKTEQESSTFIEAFAIWTEKYLSDNFGLGELFRKKYEEKMPEIEKMIEEFEDFRKRHGEKAIFYESGFPKYYDSKSLALFLRRFLGNKLSEEDICMVYGSRKPYSDIDVLHVSKTPINHTNRILDIYGFTPRLLDYRIKLFDISVTDPIISGEIVIGSEDWLGDKMNQLLTQPITMEAIYYNIIRAKEQTVLAKEQPVDSKLYYEGMSYADTCMKNALALKQGKRLLTKKALSGRYS
ncbi:MAG: hypothetical protein Q8L29_00145 [archaeon]|nr:hypothetical protein [archaeon]